MVNKFILDQRYEKILEDLGIPYKEVLRKIGLSDNFFRRKNISMSIEEVIEFSEVAKEMIGDSSLIIKLANCENLENFYPLIFAGYCNKNTLMAMRILEKYKKIIGPLKLKVIENEEIVTLEMNFIGDKKLPELFIVMEFVFLTQLMRNATGEKIIPREIISNYNLEKKDFEDFFGVKPKFGEKNIIVISKKDAIIPFKSDNPIMWEYLEPELEKRIKEFEIDESYVAEVRNALIEFIPKGDVKIEDIAKYMNCSKRTLQRRLKDEDTTFQKQLNHVRELLAKHYLKNSEITTEEIAYLLGYKDLTSFLRAFQIWTGNTITEYKQKDDF